MQPSGVSNAPLYSDLCCCEKKQYQYVFCDGTPREATNVRFVRFSACAAFVFSLPQDLKNKEKAERDARTQVAEAQHTNIKDEIAKQVGAGLPTNPTALACVRAGL